MDSVNLDDIEVYRKNDPDGMLTRIKELPVQCREAYRSALGFSLPSDYSDVDKVVIIGMGGSAIGGDLVRSLAQSESRVPVIIHRDYDLPSFINDRTLLIASSYSGNTEEVLSAFEPALRTGAKKLVMTTGGKLKEIAEASQRTQKEIARSYSVIVRNLDMRMPIEDPTYYVTKVAEKAKVSSDVEGLAIHLIKTAKRNYATTGKDPSGLAAAILYLSARMLKEKDYYLELTL